MSLRTKVIGTGGFRAFNLLTEHLFIIQQDSPYEMVFGRSTKQPIDFEIPSVRSSFATATASEYFSELRDNLRTAHDDARDKLRLAQCQQKEYYDQNENAERFSIEDRVLVFDPVNRGFPKF